METLQRKPQTHYVKTHTEYYEKVADGSKPFDLRKDDRDYQTGDTLILMNYDPVKEDFVGTSVSRKITYVLREAEHFGLQEGYCILGLEHAGNPHLRQHLKSQIMLTERRLADFPVMEDNGRLDAYKNILNRLL